MTTIDQNIRRTARSQKLDLYRNPLVQATKTLAATLPAIFLTKPIVPESELAKTLRRESARRAADDLLR